MKSVPLTEKTLKNVDSVLIHTDHTGIPIALILEYAPFVFDTRNVTRNMTGTSIIIKLGGGLAKSTALSSNEFGGFTEIDCNFTG